MIDEEEYQQFGSESDDIFSMGNSHRNDPDEVLSPSALGSGRLSLRPKPVFPDVRAQVPAHTPTQAELHSQAETNKPCNVQPSDQSSTLKDQEELFFDPVKKLILLYLSIQMIRLKIFILDIEITV